ncbi:conserved hypothetical protein [Theileria orientalis strain Shintoku]|uniref:Uncharacterized protein n=1 Tax=Theileria orientalis strain Shintoku TaxID=869250 RepID=J4CDH3_THEOR|nr:conserved hypothetical protein [Theileria orientalis strain Shintoku]BAM41142.1 conserved hypothetical protein [Theileria orientalis strain Shintoku]|eukprot:XP_009691443.1 conserved hypothetical protein [Theileria orientalis strain Shintoku]
MNKQFLLDSLNRRVDDKRPNSSGTSLFNVIKRNTNALLFNDFQRKSNESDSRDVLRSVINSGKESLSPLTRVLYKNDKLELLRSFNRHFNNKFGASELLGYVSRRYYTDLLANLDFFKQTLACDIHIFRSAQVRFSSNVLVLKGTIDHRNCEFLLNKKRLKWFLRNCYVPLSQKLVNLSNSKESASFTPERLSFLLFNSMFLANDIIITKAFILIY